jgi:Domain of unknown function (DUF4371)
MNKNADNGVAGLAGPPAKKLKQAQLTFFTQPAATVGAPSTSDASTLPSAMSGSDNTRIVTHGVDKDNPPAPTIATDPGTMKDRQIWMMPNQPMELNKEFPAKKYCDKNRRFKASFFKKFPWLHWCEEEGAVYCHPCRNVHVLGITLFAADKCGDESFRTVGFQCWRKPAVNFTQHERSMKHGESVEKWLHHVKGRDVNVQLLQHKSNEQAQNQQALERIIKSIAFLGRQGLSLRGHVEEEGNFLRLLALLSEDNPSLNAYLLGSNRRKFLSHDNQNEILRILSHRIIRNIISNISVAKHFSVIGDETTDSARLQQLSICLRWVDNNFSIHEDCIGLYEVDRANAASISSMLLDAITRCGLNVNNVRGQGYDGASVMSGSESGVASRIKDIEKRAIFVHCSGHCMSLAVQDAAKNVALVRDTLDLVKDVINFIRASPLRMRCFDLLRVQVMHDGPLTASLRPLCPTRWTVRVKSIQSLLDNYEALCSALEEAASRSTDDSSAKASGFLKRLETFETYFGLRASLAVLEHAEGCNTFLQSTNISVADAKQSAMKTADVIESMRSESQFGLLYAECEKKAVDLDLAPAVLPRIRRAPKRYDSGAEAVQFETPAQMFRQQFFELVDHAKNSIRRRFDQPGMEFACLMETVLVQAANGE